jgi:hypothetical protein
MDHNTSIKEFQFQGANEERGYRVFPDELARLIHDSMRVMAGTFPTLLGTHGLGPTSWPAAGSDLVNALEDEKG